MMDLKKEIKNLGFKLYQGNPLDDALFAQFFYSFKETKALLGIEDISLSQFLKALSAPTMCIYTFDSELKFFAWYNTCPPIFGNGLFLSLWLREDFRGSREGIAHTVLAHEIGFKSCDFILGSTSLKNIIALGLKLGYKEFKPRFPNGVCVRYLKREDFHESAYYKTYQKLRGV